MKKAIFSVCVITIIAFGAMTYLSYLSTGQVVFPMAGVLSNISDGVKQTKSSSPTTLYKWQDAQGQWHYSEQPPASGEVSTVTVNPQANIIQAPPVKEKKPAAAAAKVSSADQPVETVNPYNPAQVRQTIEDAKNVEKLLQDRAQQQEAIINQ